MAQINEAGMRRTTVDKIFAHLHDEILSLRLKPGDKISEADIAAQFGVSRQPVRDAFNRLASLDLLLTRPQRATEVKRFSMRDIERSRFVRSAVEKEVLHRAALCCDAAGASRLDAALAMQVQMLHDQNSEEFGALDYEFHKILCEIAQAEFAFDVILAEKSKVDRLCALSLSKSDSLPELVADHQDIARAITRNDPSSAVEHGLRHLSRLDKIIAQVSADNTNYFTSPLPCRD